MTKQQKAERKKQDIKKKQDGKKDKILWQKQFEQIKNHKNVNGITQSLKDKNYEIDFKKLNIIYKKHS